MMVQSLIALANWGIAHLRFLISQGMHLFWVLIRSNSARRFYMFMISNLYVMFSWSNMQNINILFFA